MWLIWPVKLRYYLIYWEAWESWGFQWKSTCHLHPENICFVSSHRHWPNDHNQVKIRLLSQWSCDSSFAKEKSPGRAVSSLPDSAELFLL